MGSDDRIFALLLLSSSRDRGRFRVTPSTIMLNRTPQSIRMRAHVLRVSCRKNDDVLLQKPPAL